jgi:hypothetical protein
MNKKQKQAAEMFKDIMNSLEDEPRIIRKRSDNENRSAYIEVYKLIDNIILELDEDSIKVIASKSKISLEQTFDNFNLEILASYFVELDRKYYKVPKSLEYDYHFESNDIMTPVMFYNTETNYYDIDNTLFNIHELINPLYVFGRTSEYPLIGEKTPGVYQFDVVNAIFYNDFKNLLEKSDYDELDTISLDTIMEFE